MNAQNQAVRNILALLKAKGWSIGRLADFAGLSRTHVGDLLAKRSTSRGGKRISMTLDTLEALADALEVPTAELLSPPKGTEKPKGEGGRVRKDTMPD